VSFVSRNGWAIRPRSEGGGRGRGDHRSKVLFGEKIGMEWNQDLNPGGLGMELKS